MNCSGKIRVMDRVNAGGGGGGGGLGTSITNVDVAGSFGSYTPGPSIVGGNTNTSNNIVNSGTEVVTIETPEEESWMSSAFSKVSSTIDSVFSSQDDPEDPFAKDINRTGRIAGQGQQTFLEYLENGLNNRYGDFVNGYNEAAYYAKNPGVAFNEIVDYVVEKPFEAVVKTGVFAGSLLFGKPVGAGAMVVEGAWSLGQGVADWAKKNPPNKDITIAQINGRDLMLTSSKAAEKLVASSFAARGGDNDGFEGTFGNISNVKSMQGIMEDLETMQAGQDKAEAASASKTQRRRKFSSIRTSGTGLLTSPATGRPKLLGG